MPGFSTIKVVLDESEPISKVGPRQSQQDVGIASSKTVSKSSNKFIETSPTHPQTNEKFVQTPTINEPSNIEQQSSSGNVCDESFGDLGYDESSHNAGYNSKEEVATNTEATSPELVPSHTSEQKLSSNKPGKSPFNQTRSRSLSRSQLPSEIVEKSKDEKISEILTLKSNITSLLGNIRDTQKLCNRYTHENQYLQDYVGSLMASGEMKK